MTEMELKAFWDLSPDGRVMCKLNWILAETGTVNEENKSVCCPAAPLIEELNVRCKHILNLVRVGKLRKPKKLLLTSNVIYHDAKMHARPPFPALHNLTQITLVNCEHIPWRDIPYASDLPKVALAISAVAKNLTSLTLRGPLIAGVLDNITMIETLQSLNLMDARPGATCSTEWYLPECLLDATSTTHPSTQLVCPNLDQDKYDIWLRETEAPLLAFVGPHHGDALALCNMAPNLCGLEVDLASLVAPYLAAQFPNLERVGLVLQLTWWEYAVQGHLKQDIGRGSLDTTRSKIRKLVKFLSLLGLY
ncbi:hypothetical protein FIBSPDRAFT_899078 [Athelia psychrophila]|uniref:Uncharacterized protein n=1 Tax=Athelia psychrophila TaxID=1759441 RepID=A0A166A654_9AGAM|nr:hypothetical protein FIBSPDRAFT_899078 [Fibularhizoctonia sp. CBS 109695]